MNENQFLKKFREIEEEFKQFLEEIKFEQDIQEYQICLENEVDDLLKVEKPKVMVYGIYNSGKSTLINALCGQVVAEMADVPTTAVISEYDCGDFILVDSPGVDAPIEHEKITEANLSKSHIILFVMSTKGIFEDKSNYKRMIKLIERKIPFLIILNDRGFSVLKSDDESQRKRKLEEHRKEILEIEYKVIGNLQKYSKDKKISDKYEILTLNAKRGLNGILNDKPQLYSKSHVEKLKKRIYQILLNDDKSNMFKQPLNNILKITHQIESEYEEELSQTKGKNFISNLETMRSMKLNLTESMRIYTKQIVYSRLEELMRAIQEEKQEALDDIRKGILEEIRQHYEANCNEIARFINENFSEYGIQVNHKVSFRSDKGNNFITSEELTTSWLMPKIQRIEVSTGNNYEKISNVSHKDKSVLDILFGFFKSTTKKEEEEYQRMLQEAEVENSRIKHWVEEQIRQRQQAKQEAYKLLDDFQRTLISQVNTALRDKFEEIENRIEEENAIENERQEQVNQKLRCIKEIEKKFSILADEVF